MANKKQQPAFPRPVVFNEKQGTLDYGETGMDLRDYFAAHVDIPWDVVMEMWRLNEKGDPTVAKLLEYRAGLRYIEANAMMVERKYKEDMDAEDKVEAPPEVSNG